MTVGPGRTADRRAWWRSHAFFLLALGVGTALRVVTMVAYRPVLLLPDSFD
ncbi:MAG TPA: hypothetical protein VFM50_05840 [Nocardioidaceae bacterium]|nr:hypothetical protein [Nocardioidaceae bacterium]